MTRKKTRAERRTRDQDRLISVGRYRTMWIAAVTTVSTLAIVPLLVMAGINYKQLRERVSVEVTRPMVSFTTDAKRTLEGFFAERLTGLTVLARQATFEGLQRPGRLDSLLANLQDSFGGIVDLGVIDGDGRQVAYSGPLDLEGLSYADRSWFRGLGEGSSKVSQASLGYRNIPHIVIAVRPNMRVGDRFVLWATVDPEVVHWLVSRDTIPQGTVNECEGCHSLGLAPEHDVFLIDGDGVLQTPSHLYGPALERTPLPELPPSDDVALVELNDRTGEPLVISYANIERTPFTLVYLSPHRTLHFSWLSLRRDLAVLLFVSIVVILATVMIGSTYVINRVREADLKRAALFHKIEYTNKLAAIGRLGAGVAHEINNPLSIISEKAGLLKDLLELPEELPPREKLVDLVNSVLKSAERCGGITHRLLGFAKEMDVRVETIDLEQLLHEVLGFLQREASYRNLEIVFSEGGDPPNIVSDRGQLQQVFLNIINNAFAAVPDGGRIEIGIREAGETSVEVSIADNGAGIKPEHIKQIFDPFFTTKKGGGTGLGLSITYGIVQKLGGQIGVESDPGKGTCFTVTLPKKPEEE